jgi:triacylglycerol esterase/lipase EstA (alpha/beta hydrolase family)
VLDSLSPQRRRLVTTLLGVVVVLVAALAVVLVRDRVEGSRRAAQGDLGPVLLVAGYGGNVRSLQPLRSALERDGRDVVVVPPVGRNTGDLAAQAEVLDRTAQRAMSDAGSDSVDVVGYSAGGLVARLWVRDGEGAQVARRVMSIGSPHHGAEVANLAVDAGLCPRACQQFSPGSAFLTRLNAGDETPAGPRWISVWSTSDRVASPPETARLEGALDVTVQEVCPRRRTTHGELPGDPVVLALLRSALGAGQPRVPTSVDC